MPVRRAGGQRPGGLDHGDAGGDRDERAADRRPRRAAARAARPRAARSTTSDDHEDHGRGRHQPDARHRHRSDPRHRDDQGRGGEGGADRASIDRQESAAAAAASSRSADSPTGVGASKLARRHAPPRRRRTSRTARPSVGRASAPSARSASSSPPAAAASAPPALPVLGVCARRLGQRGAEHSDGDGEQGQRHQHRARRARRARRSVPTAIGSVNAAAPPAESATRPAYGPEPVRPAGADHRRCRRRRGAAACDRGGQLRPGQAGGERVEPEQAGGTGAHQRRCDPYRATNAARMTTVDTAQATSGTAHQAKAPVPGTARVTTNAPPTRASTPPSG